MSSSRVPKHIAVAILAAGASSRMGTPKQLYMYEGKSLVRRAVHTALAAGFPTMVVVGASAERVRQDLAEEPVQIIENAEWREGVASSVRCAVQHVAVDIDAVILMTVDQPLVTAALLKKIVAAYESSGSPIVACRYAGTVGVPALYDRMLFGKLFALSGDIGAKQIIRKHSGQARFIDAPECEVDVDVDGDGPGEKRQSRDRR